MPTIPNYNLELEDLVGMDYLTLAKKKMLKDIKTDSILKNANDYLNQTTFKETGDISSTTNNIKNIYNLLDKSYNLLSQIGTQIKKPKDVNSLVADGNTTLIKEEPNISAEIIDKTNIISSNLVQMTDYFRLILNNPSIIPKIPLTDIEKLLKLRDKWYSKLIGDNPDRFDGVLSSQVLRIRLDRNTNLYYRFKTSGDRLRRSRGTPIGFIDVDTINDNFEEILFDWYNFDNLWNIFDKIYNAKPA